MTVFWGRVRRTGNSKDNSRSLRDDKPRKAKAKATADPYGMTTREATAKAKIQGFFPLRLRSESE
jgi:hypothetical protein